MFGFLPEICRELRGTMMEIYGIMLISITLFCICLEFFKMPDVTKDRNTEKFQEIVTRSQPSLLRHFKCLEFLIFLKIRKFYKEKMVGAIGLIFVLTQTYSTV